MNTFYEHHHDSIRFTYRCFDRILLNGLIQPFQQPERVIGFFHTYRELYPVSKAVLCDIATQYQRWVTTRAAQWGVPIIDAPAEQRRDRFVDPYFRRAEPDRVVVILQAREPARYLVAIGKPFAAAALDVPIEQYRVASLRYDLSKLRAKHLVEKLEHSHRYRLLPQGYRICVLFLKLFERVYAPLTAGLLRPVSADAAFPDQKRHRLDRLYHRLVTDLDALWRAVGLPRAA